MLLLEPQLVQRHAAVDGLHHVVDREQARRHGGERLHLDAGPAAAFDPRDHHHGRDAPPQLEVDRHPRDGDGVGEGNQVGSAFGRLDRRHPRHAQHVALPGLARRDQAERRRAHRDAARGDGDAMRACLRAHVHHVRGTSGVEMCQLSVRFSGHAGRYHKHMRATAWLIAACVALVPRAFAQNLPDLGSAGDSVLSPQMERRLGESIVRDIRFREPAYIDDPEISEYLGNLGAQLTQVTAGARHDFEFFALRDPAINAFALPGGFVGVHTGRIADAQNRAASMPYRQHLDSQEFQLVRAKLRADAGEARDAVEHFDSSIREKRYASEAAAHYGLASALLRARRAREADAEVERLHAAGGSDPMIETLAARVKQALGEPAAAAALLAAARVRHPYSNPVLYAYAAALQDTGRNAEALALLAEPLRLHPRDYRLYALQSKTYAALGKRLLQHQAQAEFYALQGSLLAAIEQLQLARSAGDGDFYQLSVVDARLKDLRAQYSLEMRDAKR